MAQSVILFSRLSGEVSCEPAQWLISDKATGAACAIPLAMAMGMTDSVNATNMAVMSRNSTRRPAR